MAQFDNLGRQIPDPRPVEVPLGYTRPPSLQEEIKRFVRNELSLRAREQGVETFEEADDFDIPEEEDEFVSEYEVQEMAVEAIDVDADPPPAPKGAGSKEPAPATSAVNAGKMDSAGSQGEPPSQGLHPPAKPA